MVITEKRLRLAIKNLIVENDDAQAYHDAMRKEYELDNKDYESYENIDQNNVHERLKAYFYIKSREYVEYFDSDEEDSEYISFQILKDSIREIFKVELSDEDYDPAIDNAVQAINDNIVLKYCNKNLHANRAQFKKSCIENFYYILNAIKNQDFYKVFMFVIESKDKIIKAMGNEVSIEQVEKLANYAYFDYHMEVDNGISSDVAFNNLKDYLESFYEFD